MKPWALFISLLLFAPFAKAEDCGLTNLASCIPEKLYQYTLSIINSPLQQLLTLVYNLLSEPVSTAGFLPLWAIIIYIISLFYSLFILFAGFNFIISGYSALRRENAKEWLKSTVLMVFFVQSSYYIYSLLIELSSTLSTGIINMINNEFFLLTIDNVPSTGMQIMLSLPYALTMLFTVILLSIRYLLVAAGVVLFPIGVFLNFIPPLRPYGKVVINILLIAVFLPFFDSLILLACSMAVDIPVFGNYKALAMIGSFTIVNVLMGLLILFAVIKAAFAALNSDIGKAARMVYKAS